MKRAPREGPRPALASVLGLEVDAHRHVLARLRKSDQRRDQAREPTRATRHRRGAFGDHRALQVVQRLKRRRQQFVHLAEEPPVERQRACPETGLRGCRNRSHGARTASRSLPVQDRRLPAARQLSAPGRRRNGGRSPRTPSTESSGRRRLRPSCARRARCACRPPPCRRLRRTCRRDARPSARR